MRHLALISILFNLHLLIPVIRAADVITWGTPTNISGDSDVVTTGSLVYAYNLGTAGVQASTVNGVSFAAWEFPSNDFVNNTTTLGGLTIHETEGYLVASNALGTVGGDFAALSAPYRILLGSGGSASRAATMQLTLTGLTVGMEYIFQWWTNNSSKATIQTSVEVMSQTTSSVGLNAVTLNANVGDTIDNTGQFVMATFTASGATKTINFDGTPSADNKPLINAFQLRVVPEPSTWIMGGFATALLAGSGFRMRRRTRN